jgi:hypothetical protein
MFIYCKVPKSKKKQKPKAERDEYDAWLKKHQSPSVPKNSTFKTLKSYSLAIPEGRDTRKYASLDTGVGNATKKTQKIYTGDKIVGIATMHKSNAVPVFNSEQAVEISSMRR